MSPVRIDVGGDSPFQMAGVNPTEGNPGPVMRTEWRGPQLLVGQVWEWHWSDVRRAVVVVRSDHVMFGPNQTPGAGKDKNKGYKSNPGDWDPERYRVRLVAGPGAPWPRSESAHSSHPPR